MEINKMSPDKLKYIVYDGEVKSKKDGDIHYISHQQVIRLFGVNPIECLLVNRPDWFRGYAPEFLKTLRILQPKQDGDYNL
jgi:hypothetical protein